MTVRCFGWRLFARSLLAGREQTFLSLITASDFGKPDAVAPELVARAAALELRAKRIFESLADRFSEHPGARELFAGLAEQEASHAELLALCQLAAGPGGFDQDALERWDEMLPEVESRIQDLASRAALVESLEQALALVLEIETSELENIFDGIMSAASCDFVRHLGVFHQAGEAHIRFLCQRIPRLVPSLEPACRQLQEAHAAVASCRHRLEPTP